MGLVYYAANAGITQLVECKLPKLDVASSSLVARSIFKRKDGRFVPLNLFGEDFVIVAIGTGICPFLYLRTYRKLGIKTIYGVETEQK